MTDAVEIVKKIRKADRARGVLLTPGQQARTEAQLPPSEKKKKKNSVADAVSRDSIVEVSGGNQKGQISREVDVDSDKTTPQEVGERSPDSDREDQSVDSDDGFQNKKRKSTSSTTDDVDAPLLRMMEVDERSRHPIFKPTVFPTTISVNQKRVLLDKSTISEKDAKDFLAQARMPGFSEGVNNVQSFIFDDAEYIITERLLVREELWAELLPTLSAAQIPEWIHYVTTACACVVWSLCCKSAEANRNTRNSIASCFIWLGSR
jgi:hypothetical protein